MDPLGPVSTFYPSGLRRGVVHPTPKQGETLSCFSWVRPLPSPGTGSSTDSGRTVGRTPFSILPAPPSVSERLDPCSVELIREFY